MGRKGYVLYWEVIHKNGEVEICRPTRLTELQAKSLEIVDYQPFKWGSYAEMVELAENENEQAE